MLTSPYLWLVLQHLGLGSGFINMITVLYTNPAAAVLTGSVCSNPFSIYSEVLVRVPHHISLFADDILLFLEKPSLSIPQVLNLFDHFGSLSGFEINWNKSCLLCLNSKIDLTPLAISIPVVQSFKYLGIDIFPS